MKWYCFHGCGQNGIMFQNLIKDIYKSLSKKGDTFEFPDGQFPLHKAGKDNDKFGWFLTYPHTLEWSNDLKIIQTDTQREIDKWINCIKKEPGDVGVMGFSQGGGMALELATHCDNIVQVVVFSPVPPPFYGNDYNDYNKYNDQTNTPVTMIISEQDKIVDCQYSRIWHSIFDNISEIIHDKGHKVGLHKKIYREIISSIKL